MNGTVFHTQQFLSYHSPGKFDFHHLLFFYDRHLVAVLPGGFRNGIYESPMGSSYGSFVVEDISTYVALAIVEAFENYIRQNKIKEVFLTSAPVIYQPIITQNLEFALLYRGYSYQRHYISHAIELGEGKVFNRFQPTARKHIRRVLRENSDIRIEEVPENEMLRGIEEFYPILLENKAKYNAKPTHTLEELLRIQNAMPGFMKLFLVRKGREPIAGSLLFLANKRVALIFYHMLRYDFDELKPIYLLMDKVTSWSKENGYAFVDIGVSQDTSDDNPMTPALSLIRFKEKFDSRGLLRSTLWKRYE
jgi:lipid II:glycine glycyltransferase (peptidoglycan interpeptide bridge formation enzyme)